MGLSALMTTTVVSMEETIRLLREKAPWCRVMVGGAVLNQEYADMIGADFYGKDAMQNMKELGKIVYLKISYEELEHRLGDLEERGVSMKEGQTLRSLYEERLPLYEKYAEDTIDCDGKSIREIVYEICEIANKE